MQIQPYFPEQIEVRGNVAAERYMVTLGFIRRVMAGHFLSIACVAAAAVRLEPLFDLATNAVVLFACLFALTVARRLLRGGLADNFVSFLLLLPTAWSLAAIVRTAYDAGHPVWIVGLCYVAASLYGAFCGRDFSFVGQFVITTFATLAIIGATGLGGLASWPEAVFWGCAGLGFVLYYVYDLAALLSRRRVGEAPAAVADLYRDLLNFITYSVRIVLHWRRFRFI